MDELMDDSMASADAAQRGARILAARARVLAKPINTRAEHDPAAATVRFRAGRGRFALPMRSVVTVVVGVRPTAIPGLPPWVAGAMPFRGGVLPVVEPDRFLGAHEGNGAERTTAVIATDGSEQVGLLVDDLDTSGDQGHPARLALPNGAGTVVASVVVETVDGHQLLDPEALFLALRRALAASGAPSTLAPARSPGTSS